jgi:hypothetical protein
LPTAWTQEPSVVVVSVALGAPVGPEAPDTAPRPDAPANVITVSDWSNVPEPSREVT